MRRVSRFSLQAGLTLLVAALFVCVIAAQYLQLSRLTSRVDHLQHSQLVLLYRIPSGDSIRAGAHFGGQDVVFKEALEFRDRENRFVARNNGAELAVELNGTPIVCQNLTWDIGHGARTRHHTIAGCHRP